MNQTSMSTKQRSEIWSRLVSNEYDVLVIGGGITGAGIAWDAASRGMRVGLVEMNDFAWGTSSRSTKLIHGGLRYLKQGEVKLVQEVGRERAILHKHARHIVHPAPMLMPIFKKGTYGYWASTVGLYVYDFLAGVKKAERRKMVRAKAAQQMEPLMRTDGLVGGGYYYEYRTDDARLTIEVVKTARERGADVLNYAQADQFLYDAKGQVNGVRLVDKLNGTTGEVRAKIVVNAAGPWVDKVREINGSKSGKHLLLTKGVHLVVDHTRLPIRQAAYFDVPGGRMIFVIPRDGKTYIGTTDTVYEAEIGRPQTTREDRDYLLHAVNHMFPTVRLIADDIESSWAGLRPLIHEEGKSPSEVSRKDEMMESDSGLLSIAGGKLTGFRKMAEKVVNRAVVRLKEQGSRQTIGSCTTDQQYLSGGDFATESIFEQFREEQRREAKRINLPVQEMDRLLRTYGSNTTVIIANLRAQQDDAVIARTGLPADEARLLVAEIRYALEEEMVGSLLDFMLRRTGLLLFDIKLARKRLVAAAAIMGHELQWSAEEEQQQIERVNQEIAHMMRFAPQK